MVQINVYECIHIWWHTYWLNYVIVSEFCGTLGVMEHIQSVMYCNESEDARLLGQQQHRWPQRVETK